MKRVKTWKPENCIESHRKACLAVFAPDWVIDPTIIRLIFILLFLGGSSGLWIYLIMLLIVPIKPE
jgi:hypothetical protein